MNGGGGRREEEKGERIGDEKNGNGDQLQRRRG